MSNPFPFPSPSPDVRARGQQTLDQIRRAEQIDVAIRIHRDTDKWRHKFPAIFGSARPSMDWSDPRQDDDSKAA